MEVQLPLAQSRTNMQIINFKVEVAMEVYFMVTIHPPQRLLLDTLLLVRLTVCRWIGNGNVAINITIYVKVEADFILSMDQL